MDKTFILEQIKLGKKTEVVFKLMKDKNISIEEAVLIIDSIVDENPTITGIQNKKVKSFSWKGVALIIILLLSAIIVGVYLNDKSQDIRPTSQIVFEEEWNDLISQASLNNKNEISRDIASKNKDLLLSQNKYISGWIGVVELVEKTLFHDAVLRVVSRTEKGSATSYLISGVPESKLSNLTIGQEIRFSGEINGTDLTTIMGFVNSVIGNDIIFVDVKDIVSNN